MVIKILVSKVVTARRRAALKSIVNVLGLVTNVVSTASVKIAQIHDLFYINMFFLVCLSLKS